MGRVVIIEFDHEIRKILLVFDFHAIDQYFGCNPFSLSAQHDRCTVGIVGADIDTLVSTHFLKAHPDIGLDIL